MMRFFEQVSGWAKLAKQYPATLEPRGPIHTKQTVQIGPVRFRRCVTVSLGPQGLWLWARPLLSRYSPMLIPWGEVKGTQRTRIYWAPALLLYIGAPEVGTIRVRGQLMAIVQTYLPPQLFMQG